LKQKIVLQMKQNWWLLSSAALLGGGVALIGSALLQWGSPQMSIGYGLPTHQVSYTGGLPGDMNTDFVGAADRSVNCVVHVKTESTVSPAYNPWFDFFGYQQQPQVQQGTGSGVIISNDGYIITNNHVVEGAQKLIVTLNNNKNYTAELVGRDPSTDIAVLKIDEDNLPAITWGNSEDVKVGEWVLAVGNPFELTSTVTAGIVSAKARNINLIGNRNNGSEEIFPVESFIQTDAAVNPGNSGGALVNAKGELVGINTAIASRTGVFSGYSFAVPTTIARKVAQDIIEFGRVQRAFIGVKISEVSEDIAKDKGLNEVAGILVNGVTASDTEIKEGDVILKVGDRAVKNVPQLQEQVAKYRPGDKVKLGIWRNNKWQEITVALKNRSGKAELSNFEAEAAANVNSLGADFGAVSNDEKMKLRIKGGAKIKSISPGKLKAAGIQPGFIITKVDEDMVETPEDLKRVLGSKSKGEGIMIEGVYPNGTRAYYGFGL
jgi:Do/DeqQ family serine protease